MKTHLVLFGPPGAGKGTQGQFLSKDLGIPFISSGDELREGINKKSEIAEKMYSFIKNGELVPDIIVEEFMSKILDQHTLDKGFILDGFPRTIHQAEFLNIYLSKINVNLDAVIFFLIPKEEIVKRISGRRTCEHCSTVYNIYFNSLKDDAKCKRCGGNLVQREDDKEEVVIRRIEVYEEKTEPLIAYYKNKGLLIEVDALGAVEEVSKCIKEVLSDRA
ncbi:MAG: adenylate kinase [Caldiserica bacterium]|nr:MAG: adenylate kinase [Caldisericota bacterium]